MSGLVKVGLCCALLLSDVNAGAAACQTVTVGLMGEFKRPTARTTQPFGAEIRRGTDIGLDVLREQGKSACLAIEQIDIANSIANIPDLIRKFAREKNIHIFLGLGSSDQALVAGDALRETRSVLFPPTASSEKLLDGDRRTVLLFPRNGEIAKFLAIEARRRGIKRVTVIFGSNNLYSQDMAGLFTREFEKRGGKIVLSIPVRIDHFSLDSELSALRSVDYTHIFLPLYELDVAKVVSELKEAGIRKDFIGTDSWGTFSRVIRAMASEVKIRALLPVVYSPEMATTENAKFVSSYRDRYHGDPTDLAAFSYDGIRLIARFVEACPNIPGTRADLQACIGRTLPFPTVTGSISSQQHLALTRPIMARDWKE